MVNTVSSNAHVQEPVVPFVVEAAEAPNKNAVESGINIIVRVSSTQKNRFAHRLLFFI